jgi:hypothetical protein
MSPSLLLIQKSYYLQDLFDMCDLSVLFMEILYIKTFLFIICFIMLIIILYLKIYYLNSFFIILILLSHYTYSYYCLKHTCNFNFIF